MWFTGEAKIYVNGRVECNNLIYTHHRKPDEADTLPHKIVKKYAPSNKPYITVWCAMNSEIYIGPYFYNGEMTPEIYKENLEKFVKELRYVTSETEHPIFIHDDSKIHSSADVTAYLEKEFPHHWVGTGSSYANWPRHSPDLNPVNFFLWGYIKSRVFKTPIQDGNLDELKERIQYAFKNVTKDLLEESIEDYKARLERVEYHEGNLVDATVYGEELDYSKIRAWGMYAWPYY